MEAAFASFGADSAGQQRPLSATAADGSLVLVCRSGGFSRPGLGVLRYTEQLSSLKASASRLAALRAQISDALPAGTGVRLVIQTARSGRSSGGTHVRPDLIGKVSGFDGDQFTVDFSRPQPPLVERKARRR